MILHPHICFNTPYPTYSVKLPVASFDRPLLKSNLQELAKRLLQVEVGPLTMKGYTTIEWKSRGLPHAIVFLITRFNGVNAKL